MKFEQFEAIKHYVEFDDSAARLLRGFHPVAAPHLQRIADDFYGAIDRAPAAHAVFTGGREQIERLKRTLVQWMNSLLAGPHDAAYLEARSRIGHVHVRIGLPQEFMFTAMNRIRTRFTEVAEAAYAAEPELRHGVLRALNQIIDIELSVMLDTYREHLVDKVLAVERLAVIGQIAASIGHELRNPLGTMESSLFLLRQRLIKLQIDDPQLSKHHSKIEDQIRICGKTINNLLDLARQRPPRRQRAKLHPILKLGLEHAALPESMTVKLQEIGDLTIDADPDDLLHVLVNLFANAAQAQGGTGAIHVSAERSKGGTVLRVADDGPGVPPDIRSRIFDALFTTRARGTGLGLALCRRILYAHGGEIELEPSQKGAVFRVWVPDVDQTGGAATSGAGLVGGTS
jgi:signal transduction histidine kinase